MSLHVLDTDTLSLLQERHAAVLVRVAACDPNDIAVTVSASRNNCPQKQRNRSLEMHWPQLKVIAPKGDAGEEGEGKINK